MVCSVRHRELHLANARKIIFCVLISLSLASLAGAQFHATPKKLLCGNRSDTSLLIVTRLLRDPLTNDKVPDFDISAG
jgi:hypothetical protein